MIAAIIAEKGLTQSAAARLLGVDQPKVSALARGQLGGFSVERLLRFLLALQRDIEITVRPAARANAAGRVSVISIA
jgi:predicted XRE-type DNA-binding protein